MVRICALVFQYENCHPDHLLSPNPTPRKSWVKFSICFQKHLHLLYLYHFRHNPVSHSGQDKVKLIKNVDTEWKLSKPDGCNLVSEWIFFEDFNFCTVEKVDRLILFELVIFDLGLPFKMMVLVSCEVLFDEFLVS